MHRNCPAMPNRGPEAGEHRKFPDKNRTRSYSIKKMNMLENLEKNLFWKKLFRKDGG
jgi:hypothetical protein